MRIEHKQVRASFVVGLLVLLGLAGIAVTAPSKTPNAESPGMSTAFDDPKVPAEHGHMRRLLDNAFRYLDPAHGLLDPDSGYPVEGWNQDPPQGLFLRSFTQLTAIGAWVELLANIAAGQADNPYLSREAALDRLALAIASLLADQNDPSLSAKGLLVNFLSLEGTARTGPLQESIERDDFIAGLGEREGPAIWRALVDKGWLQESDQGRKARILRDAGYGANHFDGPLAPHADPRLKSRVMEQLDRRAVTIILGDNANLTAALARSIGALLRPEIRDDPRATRLREDIERFIERQGEGYAHLHDPESGTFVFGWEASADRFVGWDDGRGNWVTGQMNYFINEFRGPLTFVTLRYDLPIATIRNAGFKIKPYARTDGTHAHALAAWDGSAFQLLGLSLFMGELDTPGWRKNLETLVDLELDFSTRHGLPGFLSEAYSGRGTQYTGRIGIPALAVSDHDLITHAPSLYTLGVAYMIAPERLESFLREHWPRISGLLTDHGPWEGWDMTADRVIPYQTTAHTLSLILGAIGSAPNNMRRYLDEHGLQDRLAALYAPGDRLDLLAAENPVVAWTSDGGPIEFSREPDRCHLRTSLTASGGLTFRVPANAVSLSNGRLRIRYRSQQALPDAVITFKRAEADPLPPPAIPVEILMRLDPAPTDEIEITLPATPALSGIQEIALVFQAGERATPVDLEITAFDFIPFDAAID